jgi:hypothetical protein
MFGTLSVPAALQRQEDEVARFSAGRETQARRQTLEQRIFAELSGAHSALQLHRAAADEYRRGLDTQGERLEQIAQTAYEEGELDILGLLDAWRVSLQSRLRLLDLNAASKQAEIELERVAGGRVEQRSPAEKDNLLWDRYCSRAAQAAARRYAGSAGGPKRLRSVTGPTGPSCSWSIRRWWPGPSTASPCTSRIAHVPALRRAA